jgi:ubiquinone biosynthesis protein UbiJ
MAEQSNNPKHECKCDSAKDVKALKKQVADLALEIERLHKDIEILRRAVRK